ncbi:MAG TPA: hypothetical protein VFW46_16895 [Stellaceae bacterium]|nr:hypothetical protein [Stellaceae bacterium]
MPFDPGAAQAARPVLWCAATALAALICFAGPAAAQDQDLNNEAPIVAQPAAEPAPVKKPHRKKRRPPPDEDIYGDEFVPGQAAPPPMPAPPLPSPPSVPVAQPVSAPAAPPPPPAPVAQPMPTPAGPSPGPVPVSTAGPRPEDEPWSAATLMERLCSDSLRHNEEDRLYGLISFNVRATLSYERAKFTADQIDDAVQDALDGLIKDCKRIVAADRSRRLGMVIEAIQAMTLQRMGERRRPAPRLVSESPDERKLLRRANKPLGKPTAADLSQELTAAEIDAWLDGLPPLQRALALFQYASDVTPREVAGALGIEPLAFKRDTAASRNSLMSYFREQEDGIVNNPPAATPPIEYREAGTTFAKLLETAATPNQSGAAVGPSLRISGISTDLYAGWSLLAIATGLPPDKGLDIVGPVVLATDGDNSKRMIAVAAAEITRPDEPIRRYLIKAYTVDGDEGGAGFHTTLHLVPGGVDNPEALKTLHTPGLANIEIARCLWHDYGRGPDPGLCR